MKRFHRIRNDGEPTIRFATATSWTMWKACTSDKLERVQDVSPAASSGTRTDGTRSRCLLLNIMCRTSWNCAVEARLRGFEVRPLVRFVSELRPLRHPSSPKPEPERVSFRKGTTTPFDKGFHFRSKIDARSRFFRSSPRSGRPSFGSRFTTEVNHPPRLSPVRSERERFTKVNLLSTPKSVEVLHRVKFGSVRWNESGRGFGRCTILRRTGRLST